MSWLLPLLVQLRSVMPMSRPARARLRARLRAVPPLLPAQLRRRLLRELLFRCRLPLGVFSVLPSPVVWLCCKLDAYDKRTELASSIYYQSWFMMVE